MLDFKYDDYVDKYLPLPVSSIIYSSIYKQKVETGNVKKSPFQVDKDRSGHSKIKANKNTGLSSTNFPRAKL